MNKKCSKCKSEKPYTDFNKDTAKKSGLFVHCKECVQAYNRSFDRHFRRGFVTIDYRVKHNPQYQDRPLTFTWEQFQIFKPAYKLLHEAWVRSAYARALCPSIDRIDNLRGYELNNIQIITQSENARKDRQGTDCHTSKLVAFQVETIRWLSKNYNFTQYEIARMFGVGQPCIGNIINRKTWKHIGGSIWPCL